MHTYLALTHVRERAEATAEVALLTNEFALNFTVGCEDRCYVSLK